MRPPGAEHQPLRIIRTSRRIRGRLDLPRERGDEGRAHAGGGGDGHGFGEGAGVAVLDEGQGAGAGAGGGAGGGADAGGGNGLGDLGLCLVAGLGVCGAGIPEGEEDGDEGE